MEMVDLNRIARAIETDLELPIGQKRATLHYSQLPTIEGAAVLLYQFFYNLINNSLKFSRPDAPCRIEISAIVDGDQTLIRLTDNGIGFDQEQAERIFDTFFRLLKRILTLVLDTPVALLPDALREITRND
jgi:signal transduction histidine kinase